MKKTKFWFALVLVLLVLIGAVQNREPVTTRFLFLSVQMPQAALLTITLLIGVAAGFLIALGFSRERKEF